MEQPILPGEDPHGVASSGRPALIRPPGRCPLSPQPSPFSLASTLAERRPTVAGVTAADVVEALLFAVGTGVLAQDETRSFGELGVDSLARIEICKRVQDRYGTDIESRLTEDTTPAGLSSIIEELARPQDPRPRGIAGRSARTRTENHIEIAAPIGYVWAATLDVRGWPDLFPEYASVEVLDENGSSVKFRLTTHPDENGNSWSWVSRRRWNGKTWTARAWRLETGHCEFMRLHWTFESLEADRTRMNWVQEFRMKPTAPLDDEAMAARINTNSAVQMRTIARHIEQRRCQVRDWATTKSVLARGGDLRTLVGPASCGAAFGISGFVELQPGERIDEHLHPYSEEHLLLVSGLGEVDIDDQPIPLRPQQAVLVPRNVRHRLRNTGDEALVAVFALSPLAPRPELGHVDTERRS